MNLRQQVKQQNRLLIAVCLCLFVISALFSYRFQHISDISHGQRSSLPSETQGLLALLNDDLDITAFLHDNEQVKAVKKALRALQNSKSNTSLTFIDPVNNPKTAREAAYNPDKPIRFVYQDRVTESDNIGKQSLHHSLQQLLQKPSPWIVFSTGFGERQAYDSANFNYSELGNALKEQAYKVIELDLRSVSVVPDNTDTLVLAAPVDTYNEETLNKIIQFIDVGGNVLWLSDTDSATLPQAIKDRFGIRLLDGVLVDANSQKYVESKPDFVPVDQYQNHPILNDLTSVTLFPQVRGLQAIENNQIPFTATPFLQSSISSWNETGRIRGNIAYDEGSNEVAGPINIGISFTKARQDQQEQRILWLGDADFLANAYLGNGGNQDLALRLFKWLTYQQKLLKIDTVSAPDKNLSLSNHYFYVISLLYLIILPILLLAVCAYIMYRRKKS